MTVDGKKILELDTKMFECDRQSYIDGVGKYIERKNKEAKDGREEYFLSKPLPRLREEYVEMLGINTFGDCKKSAIKTYLGRDDVCDVYRLTVFITDEIPFYSLLMVPFGAKDAPLIIAQHGGGGTPELCSDMVGKNNYNRMVLRCLKRGAVVCAPQLMLWSRKELETARECTTEYDRGKADTDLKRFGASITGLEIKGISRCIDYLSGESIVNGDKIGMVGISYGGYYTLYTMAAEERIKCGYAAASFNDKDVYDWVDWCHYKSGERFQDAEVSALVIPRRLYVAVGKGDVVFNCETAIKEAERAKRYFEHYGKKDNFVFSLWDGGHTVEDCDRGFDFLFETFN